MVYPSLALAWLNSYMNRRNSSAEPSLKIGSWVLNVVFDMLYLISRKEGFGLSFGGRNGIGSKLRLDLTEIIRKDLNSCIQFLSLDLEVLHSLL